MKRLLHIMAAPRGAQSRTLKVSAAFLEAFRQSHRDWTVDELDLFRDPLPTLTPQRVDGKYVLLEGKELCGAMKDSWKEIVAHIERFLQADGYLVSAPMWNFSIPYPLKHYIDVILQPKHLFRYTEQGEVEGLVTGKRMAVIASRGGDYETPTTRPFDHQEPYLRTVFGFVGLSDMTFIVAQPMDAAGPEVRERRLAEAIARARDVALGF